MAELGWTEDAEQIVRFRFLSRRMTTPSVFLDVKKSLLQNGIALDDPSVIVAENMILYVQN